MSWCCENFRARYAEAGKRGTGILVEKYDDGQPKIVLQFRSVEIGEEGLVNSTVLVTTCADEHIRFCPWCGVDLSKWYGGQVDALARPGLSIELTATPPKGGR